MTARCAQCGKELPKGTIAYRCRDNFLEAKYYDTSDENLYCSHGCFCEALSLEMETME